MAKQEINLGTAPNSRNGDNLRSAFSKINANFTELYTALGLANDINLNLGAFEFNGSTMSTTDSTPIVVDQAVTVNSDLTVGGDIIPSVANGGNLGSPTNPFKSLYVSNSTVYLGGVPLSLDPQTNELKVNNTPISQNITYEEIPNAPTDISDLTDTQGLLGGGSGSISVGDGNGPSVENVTEILINGTITEIEPGLVGISVSGGTVQPYLELTNSPLITQPVISGTPVTITAPAEGEGAQVEIVIGSSIPTGLNYTSTAVPGIDKIYWNSGFNQLRMSITSGSDGFAIVSDLSTELGNGANAVFVTISGTSYKLTFDSATASFLGSGPTGGTEVGLNTTNPVWTVNPGDDTVLTVTSTTLAVDGPTAPTIESITVTSAGTGYAVGQRYRVWYWQVGGNNDDSNIDFEVATVGENGQLLTIANAAFTGVGTTNTPATYSGLSIELQSSMVFDEIGPGLTLTRNQGQALYNTELELEYNRDTYLSPLGTEWNNDGWDNLVGFRTRNYTTFRSALNNAVGENIIGAELIMRDVANDRYYKFSFSVWGGNNGAYTYTRTEITDPNFFEKLDYATANDVDVIEDDSTLQIGITRGEQNGIYNPFTEEGWNSNVSPQGTLWNTDGWDDLSDIETRTYTNFYDAYNNGNLGNRVPGSKAVMYVPSIDKYYAIQWVRWTQGINGNAQGGGFSYLRYELDLTKLQQGITFADGTKLNSAEGVGRVKLTAPGNRRIEEAYGYKSVSVTVKQTNNLTTIASRIGIDTSTIWIDSTTTSIDAILDNTSAAGIWDNSTIEFSLDNSTWYRWNGSTTSDGDERGYSVILPSGTLNYNPGNAVYFRYKTGGDPQVWWDKNELPGGGGNFRGAIIDYHAYTGESTIIGTIHIVDDDGEENITHTEVTSGDSDGENDDLWLVTQEGQIKYRRIDTESKTLKVQWSAKVFYGSELYD